jgi:urea transport system substrate-binding protein
MSFYRQYAAAGMNTSVPVASTTFALGNEHKLISAEEGNGMLVAYSYFQEVDTPENHAFVERFQKKFGADSPYLNELPTRSYEGIMLWAEAVKKANTVERMAVIEALEGLSLDGPSGNISIDPKTHHGVLNVYLAELQNQTMNIVESHPAQPPSDTLLVCDLQANPDQAVFYFENGLEAAGIK